jgi:hypothetical protein
VDGQHALIPWDVLASAIGDHPVHRAPHNRLPHRPTLSGGRPGAGNAEGAESAEISLLVQPRQEARTLDLHRLVSSRDGVSSSATPNSTASASSASSASSVPSGAGKPHRRVRTFCDHACAWSCSAQLALVQN